MLLQPLVAVSCTSDAVPVNLNCRQTLAAEAGAFDGGAIWVYDAAASQPIHQTGAIEILNDAP